MPAINPIKIAATSHGALLQCVENSTELCWVNVTWECIPKDVNTFVTALKILQHLKNLSNLLLSSTGTTSKSFPLELTFLPSLSSVVLAGALSSSLSVLLSLSSLSLSSLSLNRFFFACLGFSSIPLLVPCCCSPKFDSEFFSRIKIHFDT